MKDRTMIGGSAGLWFSRRRSASLGVAGAVAILSCCCPSARAQDTSWTSSSSGFWTDSASWSAGVPANNPAVYITNALSKTVTITADTPADNLTVTNLNIWSANSTTTNTLLLSGNSTPLNVLSNLFVGFTTAGKGAHYSALTVDGGTLIAANASRTVYVGPGTTQGDNPGRGFFTQSGGTSQLPRLVVGGDYGSAGNVWVTGGLLTVTNNSSSSEIGRNGVGTLIQSGGTVIMKGATIGSSASGDGILVLTGGTNTMTGQLRIGSGGAATWQSKGAVLIGGGLLSATYQTLLVGFDGVATYTQTNGVASVGDVICGYNLYGSKGIINLSGGTLTMGGGLTVARGATCTGEVWLTGGKLNVTGGTWVNVGYAGVGTMTVSNGANWAGASVIVGNQPSSKGTLNIAGGSNVLSGAMTIGYVAGSMGTVTQSGGYLATPAVYFCSNGTSSAQGSFELSSGGVLEANTLVSGSSGNGVFASRNGGVWQFTTATPAITNNSAGSIVVTNAVIAYRNVTAADICNAQVSNITFQGANTFRLNAATNAASGQDYTFSTGSGAGSYARLELWNGATYRGGNVTIGNGGSLATLGSASAITNLTIGAGGTFEATLSATNTYSQLTALGTVTLGGTLQLNLTAPPEPFYRYTLVNKPGAGEIAGQFGSPTATASCQGTNYVFRIDYAGGDGNDLTVRAVLYRGTLVKIW